jgi:transposase
MSQSFLSCDRDQEFLLPPSLRDWLASEHLGWFVIDAVAQIDLDDFYGVYREDGRGRPAHDPAAMVALLLYAYAVGERSSRGIERRCREDVAFRVIMANRVPDHATIARFRARHQEALAEIFVEVLRLCQEAGLVHVGLVALDGTKIQASASLQANRSYGWIRSQVEAMLSEAAEVDAREDAVLGQARGDELPAELADRDARLARLRAAKERLEAELVAEHAAHEARLEERTQREAQLPAGRRLRGVKPVSPPGEVPAERRINLTDPDSQSMKSGFRYFQGYNAQAAVGEGQIILAAELTNETTDHHQLQPMLNATDRALGEIAHPHQPGMFLADAGYWTDRQVTAAVKQRRRVLVNPNTSAPLPGDTDTRLTDARGRRRGSILHTPRKPKPRGLRGVMAELMQTDACRELYQRRRVLVEPVFAQTKITRGTQRFQRRGLPACRSEWRLITATHNLLKLWHYATAIPATSG